MTNELEKENKYGKLFDHNRLLTGDNETMERKARLNRKTNETNITVELNVDGQGHYEGNEQIPFLEHLLHQLARFSLMDLKLHIEGDLSIDDHHSTEDCALVLGQCINECLRERSGIQRYGYATLPMDDALATVSVDLGGRPYYLLLQEHFRHTPNAPDLLHSGTMIGSYNPELTGEFLQKLAIAAKINLHVIIHSGQNLHHMHEIIFKALGKALRMAMAIDTNISQQDQIPSTKGSL